MSVPASTLRKLAALNLNAEQIAGVLDLLADGLEAEEARKEAQRERTRKAREKQRNSTVTLQSGDDTRGGVTRVEDITSTHKNTEQKESKKDTPDGDLLAFRAVLSPFLDTERLDALVKHRKARKAPIGAHAANLFIGAADKAGITVPDAVDACIERGWLTVKADWLAPRGRAGPASPPKEIFANGFGRLAEQMERQDAIRSETSSRSIPTLIPDLSVVHGGRR